MNRKEALAKIAEYASMFESLLGLSVSVEFDAHLFTVRIREICIAKLGAMKNPPDKRVSGDKRYTPPCLEVVCDEGSFYFIIEDIEDIYPSIDGLTIRTEGIEVRFRGD